MESIIGREAEMAKLTDYQKSGRSEKLPQPFR